MKNGNISGLPVKINSGTYTGNNTDSRAIPHGMATIPKAVLIGDRSNTDRFYIELPGQGSIQRIGGTARAMPTMDNTYFYVGLAASYIDSANVTAANYYWTAFS